MPTYKDGKIYCICSHSTNEIYIGSTIHSLESRFDKHIQQYDNVCSDVKNIYNHTTSSHIIIMYGDAYIKLIKEFPCDNKEQLVSEEGIVIRETLNCINKNKWLKETSESRAKRMSAYFEQVNKLTVATLLPDTPPTIEP